MPKISELAQTQMVFMIHKIAFMGPNFAHMGIKHEAVQSLLMDTTKKFDVVIAEWFFSSLLSGLVTYLHT